MSWTPLADTQGDTLYCWLPGWSFSPQVFSPIYNQLTGIHVGAEYIADSRMEEYAETLATELKNISTQQNGKQLIFVGWSLGGALAVHCLKQFCQQSDIPAALVTLATGERFLQEPEVSQQGMEQQTFTTFSASLEKFPAKTTKRFLGLCTQHADNARELMRELANTQISDEATLIHSLNWLNYEILPEVNAPQLHCYSHQDGFNPRRLSPAFTSAENSHCFFLTESGQTELLNSIQTLLLQLNEAQAEGV